MNYAIPHKFRLISRNEGKLKSYESCLDVRAWSHDVVARDRHLRAWIKIDMPHCVIPVSTLVRALQIMGCKSRGRLTPSCHPNCKSKIVLDSICTSCETIKECLKRDPKYEKYFEEEDFATSHWPCERCLNALKSIKMFWKIIMEKVLRIKVPKAEMAPINTSSYNFRNTARTWQADIVQEALIVKNMMPLCEQVESDKKNTQINTQDCATNGSCLFVARPIVDQQTYDTNTYNSSVVKSESYVVIPKTRHKRKRVSRSISVKIKKHDVGCGTVNIEEGGSGVNKNDFNDLQQNLNQLTADVERLKKENILLKAELQNIYTGWHTGPHLGSTTDALAYLPKPFDDEPTGSLLDDVDSEMIITMKNCKHVGYKQVSVLQVLHKSTQPFYNTQSTTDASCRREDPIHVLQKLQTTFGAMVQREVSVVSAKKSSRNPASVIKASYHNIKRSVRVVGRICPDVLAYNHSLQPTSCSRLLAHPILVKFGDHKFLYLELTDLFTKFHETL